MTWGEAPKRPPHTDGGVQGGCRCVECSAGRRAKAKLRIDIELAIARGWSTSKIMARLGAEYSVVQQVRLLTAADLDGADLAVAL